MTRDQLVRKLRDLRRLERRLAGAPDGPSPVWDRYFSVTPGERVRYPFSILLAFDRATRERAFRDYLFALWSGAGAGRMRSEADEELLAMLDLPRDAGDEAVRSAFRRLARDLHPDTGGDEELMRDLLERYRRSRYGGGAPT